MGVREMKKTKIDMDAIVRAYLGRALNSAQEMGERGVRHDHELEHFSDEAMELAKKDLEKLLGRLEGGLEKVNLEVLAVDFWRHRNKESDSIFDDSNYMFSHASFPKAMTGFKELYVFEDENGELSLGKGR
jgi:hypothetical protein